MSHDYRNGFARVNSVAEIYNKLHLFFFIYITIILLFHTFIVNFNNDNED